MDKIAICAMVAALSVGSAIAAEYKAGSLKIENLWARATPNGAKVGGGYLTIKNDGTAADKLTGGSSPIAQKVEIHEMKT